MTNRGGGRSREGGVAWGLATAKIHAKIGEQARAKVKKRNETWEKTQHQPQTSGQMGKWAKEVQGGGTCLAWRPRMQRGVGQVQRRLKSLIIASNALAQRAPRRATEKKTRSETRGKPQNQNTTGKNAKMRNEAQ